MNKTVFLIILIVISFGCNNKSAFNLVEVEKDRVLLSANKYLNSKPITVTHNIAERSAGNIHDFYSEGDYWWPNPDDLQGPYIRKDGLSNPDNFTAHRNAMIRLCDISGALASAYIISKDEKYVTHLLPHLKAWFVNEETKMNPNLLYAQAIEGRVTGRGIGIIDTIHLIEVALAINAIKNAAVVNKADIIQMELWFSKYLQWLNTHPFGEKEKNNGNNHSTCWALQVAVFAALVNDENLKNDMILFYKQTLLPEQMALDGSFPKEIARTKPYGYSLFNLDAMTSLCQILSDEEENLFDFTTNDNRNLIVGMKFLYPFIENKENWPYQKDVMYWNNWPAKQASLLFVGLHKKNQNYLDLWKRLNFDNTPEIKRNTIVKNPILWIQNNY